MTVAFSEEFREIRMWKVSLICVIVQFLTRVPTKIMNENFYNIINSKKEAYSVHFISIRLWEMNLFF